MDQKIGIFSSFVACFVNTETESCNFDIEEENNPECSKLWGRKKHQVKMYIEAKVEHL